MARAQTKKNKGFSTPPGLEYLGLVFFGALLFARAGQPSSLIFDEVHYVPAAKQLALFADNFNWVHPPLGKLLMGFAWRFFAGALNWAGDPAVFRSVTISFGLWALWAVRAWMLALGYTKKNAQIALWLTGFNFLWFVQSKTAMLDTIYLGFALWGLLDVYLSERNTSSARFFRGWILLGFSAATKWAAAPFFLIAILLSRRSWLERGFGALIALVAYAVCFLPLSFLKTNAVPFGALISYHQNMLSGFGVIASAHHPYLSHWWEWPTLMRPMWYAFENLDGNELCIWAGGNPALFAVAAPSVMVLTFVALRSLARRSPSHKALKQEERAAVVFALLYWCPLLFWGVAPRKLQIFYYFLPSSMLLGPVVVWAHEKASRLSQKRVRAELGRTQGWLLIGFTILCALLFLYFLPIMDGRPLRPGFYQNYMWFRSWI